MAKAEVIPQGEWIAGDSNLHGEPVLPVYSLPVPVLDDLSAHLPTAGAKRFNMAGIY
jgi:hypothetical protein